MKPSTYYDTSSHLRSSISTDDRKKLANQAAYILSHTSLNIDMLVATGVSGTIFGTSLADAMGLPLAIVRKAENPEPHSGRRVEGPDRCAPVKNWLFVDDLISSGATYRRVLAAMDAHYHEYAVHVGIFLYVEDYSIYGFNEAKVDVPIYNKHGLLQWVQEWKDPMNLRPQGRCMVEVPPDNPQ